MAPPQEPSSPQPSPAMGDTFHVETGADNTNYFGGQHVHNHGRPLPSAYGTPNNLRYSSAVFVGREPAMEQLSQQLSQTETLLITALALKGMGGIGKTELALQYALAALQHGTYRDGIGWFDTRELDIGTQIVDFAKAQLDLTPPDTLTLTEQVSYCWRHWPAASDTPHPVLVVFDDVTTLTQIADYLPPAEPRFRVVVTSRKRLGRLNTLELDVLKPEAALALLQSLADEARLTGQRAAAEAVVEWLGRLPLALELVGRYLANHPDLSLADLLDRLERKRLTSRALIKAEDDDDMTAKRGVAAAFELSLVELSMAAQQLAYELSLFAPTPIPWALVQTLLPDGLDEEDVEHWRGSLVNTSLLKRVSPNTYQMHPLIREFLAHWSHTTAGTTCLTSATALTADTPSPSPSAGADGWKQRYCAAMVKMAQQLPQTPTQELILAIATAMPHLAEAATSLQPWLADEDLLWPFVGLGRFYAGQGIYEQAKPWYEACLAATQARFGNDHPDVATSLNNLALLYDSQGRYAEAEPLYQQALALRQQLLGNDHPQVATSLNNLAALYESQGRYSEAEPLYQQALALRQQLLGNDHPQVATSLNNLAGLYESQGRYSEAEPLYQQALALRQQLLGNDHPDVATSLNNLALLYDSQGRYSKAEPLYQQALALRQELLGETHPQVATSLNNLAALYDLQGRYAEAEPLYQQALTLRQQLLGEAHPDVATSLNNLAGLYELQGRYAEAEPFYQQALALRQQLLGNDHPQVATSLNNLAGLYDSQGRYTEAEPLYQQALALRQELLGETHPDVATSLNNLAGLYKSQGRYVEAEPLYLKALLICHERLGPQHPNTNTVFQNFAYFVQQVVEAEQEDTLSDHPLTQNLMQQIRNA